jgi:hypothetical protein
MVLVVGAAVAGAQEAPGDDAGPLMKSPQQKAAPIERSEPAPESQEPMAPPVVYDKAIFQKPIPADQLAFLKGFDGAASNELFRDKQFKRVLKAGVPDVMFHYGRDMPLPAALEQVLSGSPMPVRVVGDRYVTLEGRASLYPGLAGKGFVWVDMQDGLVLGGFYFHPSNGEPTPSVTVFSQQIGEEAITLGELPPEFADELREWSQRAGVPLVTTRYFIGDTHEKILLEHDEDFCSAGANGRPLGNLGDDCLEMNVNAADLDEGAAYFLDQVHYATNATAYMLGPDQIEFLRVRERTCGSVVDPMACRIRVSRERTRVILKRSPVIRVKR